FALGILIFLNISTQLCSLVAQRISIFPHFW
ncbi:MAG: hypothetical protein ACI8RD_014557, partial [Bacillariaceae sp.]